MKKYIIYDYFDNFYLGILGICDTEADAQELILAAAEEEAYNAFLDDYYYDETGITVKPGENPMEIYLNDKILEWKEYNKSRFPLGDDNNISFYAWTLLMAADYYNYSIGEEY